MKLRWLFLVGVPSALLARPILGIASPASGSSKEACFGWQGQKGLALQQAPFYRLDPLLSEEFDSGAPVQSRWANYAQQPPRYARDPQVSTAGEYIQSET